MIGLRHVVAAFLAHCQVPPSTDDSDPRDRPVPQTGSVRLDRDELSRLFREELGYR